MLNIRTVDRHIMEQERKLPGVSGEFSGLLHDIALAGKMITKEVRRAGLIDILGTTEEINIQGEIVQKLDEYANDLLINTLTRSGRVCAMASEENVGIIEVPENVTAGKYLVSIDPLDGSSNIDVNVSIGTIFSIHKKISSGPMGGSEDFLQEGSRQVAAGYVIYGSSTMLVYTTGSGVHGFTLDPSVGEFLLSHEDMRMPEACNIFSINEGNYNYWDEGTRRYIDYVKEIDGPTNRPYSSRYIGTFVSDFHRNLIYGGIFLYPVDYKDPEKAEGKLRLLFEAAPMAMIVEQAGGYASTGKERILDIVPTEIHQRVPLIIGTREEVLRYEEFARRFSGEAQN
jgi:fructose-1,6-bisphosphatase I